MKDSMMRVSRETKNLIKLLKQSTGSKLSQQETVEDLVRKELTNTFVDSLEGFLEAGNVVCGPEGKILVIDRVDCDRVTFRDGSFMINGSSASFNLGFVAESVKGYDGGLIRE